MWGVGVPMTLGWGISKVVMFTKHPVCARYRFPHHPKVESSSEKFHKPKWCKVKKQLPQGTSCEQMHKTNREKAQMRADTAHSYGGLVLSVVPGEGAGSRHPHGSRCSLHNHH